MTGSTRAENGSRRFDVGLRPLRALAILCCFAFARPARAQWTPRVESRVPNVSAPHSSGELIVNGVVVLRLRSGLGGYPPEQRVEVAAERLRAAVAAGLKPSDVQVDTQTSATTPRLKVLGQVIVTANADEARAAGWSPAALVQSWAEALRKALALPGLTAVPDHVLVPLGETRLVRLGGVARGAVTVESTLVDSKIVSPRVDLAAGAVTLAGISVGKGTFTLIREGASATITVAVERYAGRIETPRPVTVTGTTASAELVARYALASAVAAARLSPGAAVQVAAPAINVAALSAGQTQTVEVPLSLDGPDMIPVRGVARVPIASRTLPPLETATLLYSNNPERITRFGTLFVGRLTTRIGSTRLLYHHQSAMDKAVWFTVELINESDTRARVQVVGGAAGPVLDTVWVGYRACSLFIRDFLQDVGAFVEVPRRSRVALTALRLAPGLTISGLAQLRQIDGNPLLVRVAADIPGGEQTVPSELLPVPWSAGEGMAAPFTLSGQVYPLPRKAVEASYQAGGRWTFVSIGSEPMKAANEACLLEGDYGVFYDIVLTLENHTSQAASAEIVFEPSAGMAGGIFLIDGRLVEIPQARMPAEVVLARYSLPPGAKQAVQIKTLPLSGSAYPARLIVRP